MNTNTKNTILLIIRLVVGGFIAWSGFMKLMNIDQTIQAFSQSFDLSPWLTWSVAIGELISGLGLIFGIWTRLAAAGALIIMIGAVYYTKAQVMDAILLLVGSTFLTIVGGGNWVLIKSHPKDKIIVAPSTADLPKF